MPQDRNIDLSGLTLRQLELLSQRVASEIAAKRADARRWLQEMGNQKPVVERGARYRNPRNAAETWSGRGPRPRWVEEALAGGLTLEALENADILPVPREPSEG